MKKEVETAKGKSGISYEKLGGQKKFIFLQLPHYLSLPPFIGGTCHFCPPVEAMHAATIMSRKDIGPQYMYGTVLTRRQIHQFSPNFSRTIGSEAVKKWEGKDLFSPLASKSRGAFALPALQHVPPLATG